MQAPFPWFGGKSAVADEVWLRFGAVPNYVEPFFGSGAVLLRRSETTWTGGCDRETINDYDGHVANFWRACKHDPDGVADAADRIIHELDLHAVGDALFCRPSSQWNMKPTEWVQWIREDESHYDARRAGQWCWFVANWIGGLPSVDGGQHVGSDGGVHKRRPQLGRAGQGVSRQRPHLGDAGKGVSRQLPHLSDAGNGVSRQLPHLSDAGNGECARRNFVIREWMRALSDRLRNVRCCCGDWSRVCGKAVTWSNATPCAVFLDPPYSAEAGRDNQLYSEESLDVAHAVREWAIEEGKRPDMRIALCGYDGEHAMPDGWRAYEWKTQGGYGKIGNGAAKDNCHRERIWFSPACIVPRVDRQAMLAIVGD